jgi:hypothetical protein
MTNLPGGMAWHAPLAVCSPGLVVLLGAVATACIPAGRGRWWVSTVTLGLGLLVTLAVLRASLLQEGGRLSLMDGWCEGGGAWVVLASLASVMAFFTAEGPARVGVVGLAFLSVVIGPWWCHIVLAVLVMARARGTVRGRLPLVGWAVLLVVAACLPQVPKGALS